MSIHKRISIRTTFRSNIASRQTAPEVVFRGQELKGEAQMKTFIGILLVLGFAVLVDQILLGGQYSNALLYEGRRQATDINGAIHTWFRQMGI